jgi:hypothetical protein
MTGGEVSTQSSISEPLPIVVFLRDVGMLHGVKRKGEKNKRSL